MQKNESALAELGPTTTGRQEIARIKCFHGLAEFQPAYDGFFEEAAQSTYFLCLPWFRCLCEHGLEEGAAIRFYILENDATGEPILCLPTRKPAGQNGSRFMGYPGFRRALAGLTNYQSKLYAPMIGPNSLDPSRDLERLLDHIVHERPKLAFLDFNMIPGDSEAYRMLKRAMERPSWSVYSYFYAGNWYEPLEGRSYKEYLADRPSRLRNTLRRKTAKLEKLATVRFVLTSDEKGLDAAIGDYQKVLGSSWKDNELFPNLIEKVARTAAERGALRLGILYVDEEPAAAQIWLLHGGRAVIYKLHYDERFKSQSVGTILTARIAEQVIDEDQVSELDFGAFDEVYKADWMTQRRELMGLVAFNRFSLQGLAAMSRFLVGRKTRSLRRKWIHKKNLRSTGLGTDRQTKSGQPS